MQTIEQALKLLEYFSEQHPEYGLSDLARQAGFDKAKTRRYLVALINQGLIEQNSLTKKYRLGAALLRLARVREACFPIEQLITPILEGLVSRVGETAHFSLMTGETLGNINVVESPKAHRITMERGEILPLHATASGLAYLAHAAPEFTRSFLGKKLEAFTPATETAPNKIEKNLAQIRKQGIAKSPGSYDEGVTSFAMPIHGGQEYAIGAIAVAAPSSRIDKRTQDAISRELQQAVADIETAISGDRSMPATKSARVTSL